MTSSSPILRALWVVMALTATGCAAPGASTSPAGSVYVFTPEERRMAPNPQASGYAAYCHAGMVTLAQSRRQEALAAIAQVCGGPERYALVHEEGASVKVGPFSCVGMAGRRLHFRCLGGHPPATAQ